MNIAKLFLFDWPHQLAVSFDQEQYINGKEEIQIEDRQEDDEATMKKPMRKGTKMNRSKDLWRILFERTGKTA